MLNLIAPPSLEPLSLADAKVHLKVDGTEEDALIGQMIVAARLACEHALGRALLEQVWERVLPAFPAAGILLGKPRVQQIVSVKYVDEDGVQQTLAPELYALDADSGPGWLFCALGAQWPGTRAVPGAVRVRFTAGYGAEAASVPANVVAWLKLQVGALYRNREAFAGSGAAIELPGRFTDALLDSERVYL
jgi:uncharacterized phiE125 gp8 family phage protein